jgi:hypothetical protein
MNILILTPDAVGSTLLQRLVTIYMQFYEYDKPVINLHELTNGLEKYYSPEFNREIVSKKKVENWGYYQSLEEIVEILASADHYKTSRLAQYHIKNRQDSIEQQIPFYRYLDKNFYIISCRRKNVFEHALSMAINKITKKLNVYSVEEKIDTFLEIYKNHIEIDIESLISSLNAYKNYLAWVDDYFNVASYFYYDKHLENIEQYILDLPIFPKSNNRITWKEKFDIDFNDWNRCHHSTSDIGSLVLENKFDFKLLENNTLDDNLVNYYQQHASSDWPSIKSIDDFHCLPEDIKLQFHDINWALTNNIPESHQNFYFTHLSNYQKVNQTIDAMIKLDIIVTPPPIKKQTLAEKRYMVKNFEQCVDAYNDWIEKNPGVSEILEISEIERQIKKEYDFWNLPKKQLEKGALSLISKEK